MAGQAKDETKAGQENSALADVAKAAEARASTKKAAEEPGDKKDSGQKQKVEEEPQKSNRAEDDGEQAPVDDGDEDEVDGDDEEGDGDGEQAPVDDDLLERAIRAGMSMKEAKAVSDKDALASIVGRLESKEKADGKPSDKAPSLLDELPDLGSDKFEGYPAEIIGALKSQQEVIRKLHTALEASVSKKTSAEAPANNGKDNNGKDQAREKSESRKHRVVNQPRSSSGQFVADQVADTYEKRRERAVEEVRAMMSTD